jgi:mycothiol synthase
MPKSDPPGPPAGAAPVITAHAPPTEAEAQAVLSLVSAAADADGVGPLSEHVMLHLRYGGESAARDLLLVSNGELAGYAHLEPAGPAADHDGETGETGEDGDSGELVIHPAHRRQGLGLALVRALAAEAGERPLRLWAHGDLPAAARLAAAAGFERVRALWQMRRPLQAEIEPPRLPGGVTVRTFVVGQDEASWLDLNARAFARHPEQGGWTREDLDLREREPWFDPEGFFLAERGGRLAGFHWTKIHAGAEPIGEVYVVGVDPTERGAGLGHTLTLVGLRYLRDRGLHQVMLYVDESNWAAIRMYESLGFVRWHTDVMFSNAAKRDENQLETDAPATGRTPST